MDSDPEELAATLGERARLDPVELGLEAVLERIVQAAAAGQPRCSLAGTQVRLAEGPSVNAFLQAAPVPAATLPPSLAGPTFARWRWRRVSGRG